MTDDDAGGDDADAPDVIDLALDIAEAGNVVLRFPGRLGGLPRFGYHRGRWMLVTVTPKHHTAYTVERESVYEAIAEADDIEVESGADDTAWRWFLRGGDEETVKATCTCGEFKWSNNINVVQRWVERHKTNCHSTPSIVHDL